MLSLVNPQQREASAATARDSGRYWCDRLILGCQVLAGRSLDASPRQLIWDLRKLARDLPSKVSVRDLLLIRSLFGRALAQIVRSSDVERRAETTRTLLDWMMSTETSDGWYEELNRLLDGLDAILAGRDDRLVPRQDDRHVARALHVLDVRHRDPHLTLDALAAETELSAGYLTRLLKRHTGCGFLSHVHRRRVAAARCLLLRTTLSVKEIAAAVGYEGSTQLCRQVKRLCGITPLALRRAASNSVMRPRDEEDPLVSPHSKI
jgi:AraC-like DNA-binding protein